MATIVLRPRWYDIGPFREQYDALIAALEAEGHEVRVEHEVEKRSAGEVARTLYDLAIHVADEALVSTIVALLLKKLGGKPILGPNRGKRRRVFIFGPRNEVLREVEVPDD